MPVGQLLGQQPRRPSKWRGLADWRDWKISVKLAAVTLVPIIIALVLGGITISNQVSRSGNYERIDRLVKLSTDVRSLVDALQQERIGTTALLTQGTVGSSPQLDAARAATDKALQPIAADTSRVTQLDTAASAPGTAANNALARLGQVRQQVAGGRLDSLQALDAYSAMTGPLLTLDTSLVAGVSDDALSGTANALHDLLVAKEEVSTSQSLVTYGISRGMLPPTQLNQVRAGEIRLADRLEDFRAAGDGAQEQDFDRSVMGPEFDTRGRLVGSVLNTQSSSASDVLAGLSAQQWTASSTAVVNGMRGLSDRMGAQLSGQSTDLVESSGSDAGLLAVLLFAALIVTGVVVFLITRQLLRSLRLLRTSALDVADRQLPAAVQNIQEGREQSAEVSPVAVGSADEIGEVAKAFDAVHSQALRLAIEQAAMRTGYSSVFINLSRRSQSLVQRQLQLIERLERDEEDADQLATLFQLDHLATRMRRNNENLMVLSGAEPGRRSGQPVSTGDVLRAAVSEIEQYQRVVVQTPPNARIVGYAASDLMRLIAELLDNATAFSAPETQVTVSTRVADGGRLLIDIMDKGIGMNEAEVAEANARLTEAASVDLATSRRMGLFVVGRLAGRHNIGVVLHGGKDIVGVRATVSVPADLVMDLPEQTTTTTPPPEAGSLPRRGINGTSRPGALTSLAGATSGTLGDGAAAPGAWTQNGHSGMLPPRPPSDVEVSGTALFSPISPEDMPEPQALAPEPPLPAVPEQAAEPEPGELPSGKELFEANVSPGALTEWWSAAAAEPKPPVREPRPDETTPIFDETLSAWFRSEQPAPAEEKEAEDKPETKPEPRATTGWDFAVDESWRTVQQVSQHEPTSYTEAGLPRRRRGEQLMPGSAAPGGVTPSSPAPGAAPEGSQPAPEEAKPALPSRNAADVRGRLSSFQHGVNRARHAKDQPAPGAETAPADAAAAESRQATPLPQRRAQPQPWPAAEPQQPAESEQPSAGPGALPQRRPRPQRPQGAPENVQAQPEEALPQAGSAAEGGLPQRQSESGQLHGDTGRTDSGLPRREPVQAADSGLSEQQADTGAPQRAADTGLPQRGTDSGMPRREPAQAADTGLPQRQTGSGLPQRGVGAGLPQPGSGLPQRQRAQAPETAAPHGQADPGLPQRQPGLDNPLPRRRPGAERPAETSGAFLWQPSEPAPAAPAPAAPAEDSAWSFATDESWRTVEAVSQAGPTGYTAAGLPRRRRGEQLMPGSASSAGAPGPRAQRDPQDVRGRLSSFQQGVRRGRHRTTQPVDSEHETMEGE
ncbi:HAMP domain-containing protein [Amycolatopsis sp. K13G38]|uniref:histidine kinase n=1 Tax=Amycolatopsis acididurans TaxID=2724524 RepID=A0ABX1J283_9PSEU|nr:HAMP domain-containing protein [Amycolatopsis acididurans]